MIYYHVSVFTQDRLMHDGYYSRIEEAVETAKWWIKANCNVRTWVSYH